MACPNCRKLGLVLSKSKHTLRAFDRTYRLFGRSESLPPHLRCQSSWTLGILEGSHTFKRISPTFSSSYSTQPLKQTELDSSLVQEGRTILDKKHGILRISKSGKRWESVIGLEVHSQIHSKSKLFSDSPNQFNQPVNTKVSYFDAAIPGTLPVLNSRCVKAAVEASLAMGANINLVSYFDRKHYFYADLPAGYQITQHRKPISQGGSLTFTVRNENLNKIYTKSSNLVQIQIEQDSGKSLHDDVGGYSLIDLNRCGVGLLELVFSPDLQHGEEAAALAKELTLILQCLNVSRGRMERGEIRVDANISVREIGAPLGTRTEVKNLNSLRSVSRAVEYEVWRQITSLENGEEIENETRGFDFDSRRTLSMRDKERKQDYRFMPEPNLPPLVLDESMIENLQNNLPELPAITREKLQTEHGLSQDFSVQLVDKPEFLTLFRGCADLKPMNCKAVANVILLIIQEYLTEHDVELSMPSSSESLPDDEKLPNTVSISPQCLVEAVDLRESKIINFTALRLLVRKLLSGDTRTPETIVNEEQWRLIADIQTIQAFVDDVLANNVSAVEKYVKAKEKKKAQILKQVFKFANSDPRSEKVDMAIFSQLINESIKKNSGIEQIRKQSKGHFI